MCSAAFEPLLGAFLRDSDGWFDWPILVFSAPLAFIGVGMWIYLPVALHRGQILFRWTPRYGATTIQAEFDRKSRPLAFWSLFVVYSVLSVLCLAGVLYMLSGPHYGDA